MIGASGGEFGVRGFVAAFDPDTGKELWRTLHGAGARRAGQRDVAEGRSVEDRRRAGVGHRQLRSRDQPRVLGHRQRRPVDGRPASRRQPLRRVDRRDRRRAPDRSRGTSSTTRTSRGTGTKSRRRILVDYQRNGRTIKGLDQRRAQRLPLVPRAHDRPDQVRRGQAVRQAERLPRPRSRRPGRPDVDPARKPGTGKTRRVLSRRARRQELAADRVQPADADDLHPGQQQPVRSADGRARAPTTRGKGFAGTQCRRPGVRGARRRSRRREVQAWNVDTGQRVWMHDYEVSPNWGSMLATAGGARVQRRHQRSQDSRVRRGDRQAALGVRDQLRHRRAADARSPWTASSTSPCSRAGAATCAA